MISPKQANVERLFNDLADELKLKADQHLLDVWINPKVMIGQWEDGVTLLNDQQVDYFLMPWRALPYERDADLVVAAISSRVQQQFYLIDPDGPKNISLYNASQSILVDDKLARIYLQAFNPELKIATDIDAPLQIKLDKTRDVSTLPNIAALSLREFIPTTAHGMLCAVCHRKDIETRKFLRTVHDELAGEVGNLERAVHKGFPDFVKENNFLKEKHILAAYVELDSNGHYHGSCAVQLKDKIKYIYYSQSTTVNFVDYFTQKIKDACI